MKRILDTIFDLIKRNEKQLILFFLFAIGIIKLPSLYILFESRFTSTLTLAKLILILFFGLFTLYFLKLKKSPNGTVFNLLLLVFITQSFSVINARDIISFLRQYQNLILSIVIFVSSYYAIQTTFLKQNIFKYIVIVGIITIGIESFFVITPQLFIQTFTYFIPIQNELMDLYLYNFYNLSRYNLYLHSELFLPFFLFFIVNKKYSAKQKIASILAVIILFILTLASKYRTRLLQAVFAIGSYLLSIRTNFRKLLYIFLLGVLLIGSYIGANYIADHTIFDRVLYADEREDEGTIEFRIEQLRHAIELAQAYPLFGAGLGNYKEYTDLSRGLGISDYYQKQHFIATINTPHSIVSELLSETGILGFGSYFILVLYFGVKDFQYYRKSKDHNSDKNISFIIASWTVFVYGIMNPFSTIFLTGWFWFLRGILQGNIYLTHESKK